MSATWPPRVKVCGITRHEDAVVAVHAGAAFLGTILAPGYRRTVTPEAAAAIFGDLPARRVGVFVNASADELLRSAEAAGLHVLQLHGDEPPALAAEMRAAGYEVWKAVRPRGGEELAVAIDAYRDSVDALLVDGWSAEAAGGSGTRFDWGEVAGYRQKVPDGVVFIAAGGLTPENVAEAARVLRPDVVDVSSGVESAPGVKDAGKVEAFAAAVRSLSSES